MKKEWRVFIAAVAILLITSNFLTFKFASTPFTYSLHRDASLNSEADRILSTTKSSRTTTTTAPETQQQQRPPFPTKVAFPAEYQEEWEIDTDWCRDRYSTKYLLDLANSQQEYCENASSSSSFYCYHISVGGDVGFDAFCTSSSQTEFKKDEKKFVLKCNQKQNIQPSLDSLPLYWYGTGPGPIIRNYLSLSADANDLPNNFDRRFSILVKREDALDNLWHVLMQIESVLLTLDVMSITLDHEGKPLYTPEDIMNTQVLITDDMQSSIFRPLWQLVGNRPVRRFSDLEQDEFVPSERIVVPLAGKSNPMWQGDWESHVCHRSELLKVFANRVLKRQGLQPSSRKDNDRPPKITWIDRKGSRRLLDQDQHIQRIKEKFKDVDIQVIDFASLALPEQLKIVQETDILAGVHGAGLTHGMFLSPGASLVELQPPGLNHRGFRNMAHLIEVQYFLTHADSSEGSSDWHEASVGLSASKFDSIIETSIKAMSQTGLRTVDVA